ncbi:MAG: esterase YqiA [Pseudomonadales bacterium]|nr:esterase YqiA [Pseudomonadales bacterium]
MDAVVYLHGFNSSSQALKAQETSRFLKTHYPKIAFYSPSIPDLPDEAERYLKQYFSDLVIQHQHIVIIGSSLGGFYATWLAETFDCLAVLVNPAVRPHLLMEKYLGWNENPYSHKQYQLTAAHMKTLQSLYSGNIYKPSRFLVLLQMADEVLDATQASLRFYQSPCRISPGGDHRFQDFDGCLPGVFNWVTENIGAHS